MAEGLGAPRLCLVQRPPHRIDADTCFKKGPACLRGSLHWGLTPDCGTPAPQLMKCVRLPLLSRDFLLGHVDAESLVRHHPDCKDLLIEALKFHLLPEQRGVLGTSRTRPRRCEGAGPVLFAVGMFTRHVPSCLGPSPTRPPSPLPSLTCAFYP